LLLKGAVVGPGSHESFCQGIYVVLHIERIDSVYYKKNKKMFTHILRSTRRVSDQSGCMSRTEVVTLISMTEVTLPDIPQDRIASKLFPKIVRNFRKVF
jgi:hypothetical protein